MGLLLIATAAAWSGILGLGPQIARRMQEPEATHAAALSPIGEATGFLAGWGIMMVAMMLPSAAPMVEAYRKVRLHSEGRGVRAIPPVLFAMVYVVVWLAFGIPVYAANALLASAAEIYGGLILLLPYGVAAVLVLAGAYQLSPWKAACLRVCRSPLQFLIGRWREGYRGTLGLALEHAAYCVGCCWLLMAILVAAGAMGLRWVLLIIAVVTVEKLLPYGDRAARIIGTALMLAGALVALEPELAFIMRAQGM
jgi:predicted metal-binding membrane protein